MSGYTSEQTVIWVKLKAAWDKRPVEKPFGPRAQ